MIKDPAWLSGSTGHQDIYDALKEMLTNHFDCSTEPVFFGVKLDGRCTELYLASGLMRDHWSICDGIFYVNSKPVSKEAFLNNLKENFPDHFEWILFHPEWL